MTTTYLNKTFSTPTNSKKYTMAAWFKRSGLSSNQYLYSYDSGGNAMFVIGFYATDKFTVYDRDASSGSDDINYVTTQVFRDTTAWYHLVVAVDTTDGTAGDRVKIYVNGERLTAFDTSIQPAQDYDTIANSAVSKDIGRWQAGSNYYYGYMSQFIFLDGYALTPSSFGSTNANGVWIPNTSPSVTYGNNGFKLDFADSGASAAAGNFGSDSSGNNHHFTSNNLGTNPNTTDTPHNLFATLNLLASTNTVTEGALKAVTKSSKRVGSMSSFGVSSGKWYAEYKVVDASGSAAIGIENDAGVSFYNFDENVDWWNNSNAYAYQADGNKRTTGVNASYGSSYTAGDIIGVALDMDNRKLYFSKNGTFQDSGDPTSGSTGTGAAFTVTDGFTYFFQFADQSTAATSTFQANFGNPTFTIASGNADANGYGNFEYAVPSGYYALCTKNLAQYGG